MVIVIVAFFITGLTKSHVPLSRVQGLQGIRLQGRAFRV